MELADDGVNGLLIKHISKTGALHRDGRVQPGDYLLGKCFSSHNPSGNISNCHSSLSSSSSSIKFLLKLFIFDLFVSSINQYPQFLFLFFLCNLLVLFGLSSVRLHHQRLPFSLSHSPFRLHSGFLDRRTIHSTNSTDSLSHQ